MKVVYEELFTNPGSPGMIVVTTNAVVKDGSLVMGAGAARDAKRKIPGIAERCGLLVSGIGSPYGFLPVIQPADSRVGFGIFQTKNRYQDKAELEIIKRSTEMLTQYARQCPDWQFRMNFPGIGHGQLLRQDVEPIIASLPANVTVCAKPGTGTINMSELFTIIHDHLRAGRRRTAIEHMEDLGFEDAERQVNAVQEMIDAESDRIRERVALIQQRQGGFWR